MRPWRDVARDASQRRKKLELEEIVDLTLPLLVKHQRLRIPQFTKVGSWFDGLEKSAPRTLRQQ